MDRQCSRCGSPATDARSQYCNFCGEPFTRIGQPEQVICCTRCGTQCTDPLSRFCYKCGSPLKLPQVPKKEIICRQCGAVAPDGSTFCARCGSDIHGGKRLMSGILCPACGKYIQDETRYYCNHCGTYLKSSLPGKPEKKIHANSPSAPGSSGLIRGNHPARSAGLRRDFTEPAQRNRSRPPLRVIGGVIALLIIVGIFIFADVGSIIPPVSLLNASVPLSGSLPGLAGAENPVSSQIEIRINHVGSWTGVYDSGGSAIPVNGVGARSIVVSGPASKIQGTFTKGGQDTKPMTVQILKDGAVVKTGSTSSPKGVVAIAYPGS